MIMNEHSSYLISFNRAASKLREVGFDFDKSLAKNNPIVVECRELARKFIPDLDEIIASSDNGLRDYCIKIFDKTQMDFLFSDMDIQLDFGHLLILYYYIKRYEKKLVLHSKIQGILCQVAADELENELTAISKVAIKNKVNPIFEKSREFFNWRRCPFILRRYMLGYSQVNDFNTYVYEKKNIAHIAYLVAKGRTIDEAQNYLSKMTDGLFYTFLPLEVEDKMLQHILSGDYLNMDGIFGKDYLIDKDNVEADYNASDMYTVFNMLVKPVMLELVGMTIEAVLEEIYSNNVRPSECYIYHLSPYRFGVALKSYYKLEDVAPIYCSYLKQVPKMNARSYTLGEFI